MFRKYKIFPFIYDYFLYYGFIFLIYFLTYLLKLDRMYNYFIDNEIFLINIEILF